MKLELPPQADGATIHVGFSGGLDSTVLLHQLAMQSPSRIHAVHIHHGLQASADAWAARCAAFCTTLDIRFTVVHLRLDPAQAAGPEAAARAARYAAFRSVMNAGDCLTTAHHRDDQAETVLLRLLRGTGVQGFAGMRPLVEFAPGWLWRPLLDTPRTELRQYAESQDLSWIDDPHNVDSRYARSWLRAEVMPKLKERFPQTARSLGRAASLAAEASELLDELAALDAATARLGDALSVTALQQLSVPRRHNLLRAWLREQRFEVPFAAELRLFSEEVLNAAPDASPRLAWAGCELRRYRDLLFAMAPVEDVPPAWSACWRADRQLQLPADGGWLEAAKQPDCIVRVRFPRDGERFKPSESGHTRTLKNLFQESGVPPWIRARAPVIEHDGAVIAVAGLGGTAFWREYRDSTMGALHWHHALKGAVSPIAL